MSDGSLVVVNSTMTQSHWFRMEDGQLVPRRPNYLVRGVNYRLHGEIFITSMRGPQFRPAARNVVLM